MLLLAYAKKTKPCTGNDTGFFTKYKKMNVCGRYLRLMVYVYVYVSASSL